MPHLEPQRVRDLPQRRATPDPQLAVHAVPEELVAVAARARPGVEHGLAVLDDQDGVAGLVAAVVGVRGVGPEAVLGVVGTHLERARGQDQALAGEHRGERGAPAGRGVGDRVPGQVEVGAAPALPHELRVRLRHGRVVRLRVQVLGQRLPALRGRGVECRLVAGVAAHPARVRRSGAPGPAPVTLLRMDGATATGQVKVRRDSRAFTVVVGVLVVPRRHPDAARGRHLQRPRHHARRDGPGRRAGGPAGALLPVARPLRARAAPAAPHGSAVGRLRRDVRCPGRPGDRRRLRRCDRGGLARRRGPGQRGAHEGAVPLLPAVVAPGRAGRDPRRHRLRGHGRHRLRLHREHPLPRRGLQRLRRDGPGRRRRRHHHVRPPLPVQPVRAPAVHGVHGDRHRHRGDDPAPGAALARSRPRLPVRGAGARALERLDDLRREGLLRDLPLHHGPRVRRPHLARRVGAAVGAADADRLAR